MSEIESLLFYIICFFASFVLYYIYNKNDKKFFIIASFIIPLLVGGLRYGVGTDFFTYVGMYEKHSKVSLGFELFCLIARLFDNYMVMFFLFNFFTLLFVFLGLRNINKEIRPLAYFCYLFMFYTTSFNVIRQGLAVAIIFYAYKYIINKSFLKWSIFIIIASLFHITAILVFPFYIVFTSQKNFVKLFYLVLFMVVALNYTAIINYIGRFNLFRHYVIYVNDYNIKSNNYMFFANIILLLYYLSNRQKYYKFDETRNTLYIYIYITGVCLQLTGFVNPFVKRIADYFLISNIVLLGSLPYVFKIKNNVLIHKVGVFLYVLMLFIVAVFVLGHSNIIPYRFVGG